jgi:hypothetical protein
MMNIEQAAATYYVWEDAVRDIKPKIIAMNCLVYSIVKE